MGFLNLSLEHSDIMQNQSKLYKVLLAYFDTQGENVLYGSCLLSVLSANCITRCGDQNLVHTLAEYWSKLGLYMADIIIGWLLVECWWVSVDMSADVCQLSVSSATAALSSNSLKIFHLDYANSWFSSVIWSCICSRSCIFSRHCNLLFLSLF